MLVLLRCRQETTRLARQKSGLQTRLQETQEMSGVLRGYQDKLAMLSDQIQIEAEESEQAHQLLKRHTKDLETVLEGWCSVCFCCWWWRCCCCCCSLSRDVSVVVAFD